MKNSKSFTSFQNSALLTYIISLRAHAIIPIFSLIIWLIPSIFLGSVTGQIDRLELKDSLTEAEEQYLVELYWTQIWWETQQATIFNPVAIVLFAISLLTMLYGVIVKFGW